MAPCLIFDGRTLEEKVLGTIRGYDDGEFVLGATVEFVFVSVGVLTGTGILAFIGK